MPLSFQRTPEPGETRDCLDPWTFFVLRADGDVALCCRSPAVGNLRREPLAQILEGPAARALRAELLRGELAEHCRSCCERGVTDPVRLRERVRRHVEEGGPERIAALREENARLRQARTELARERDALREHAATLEAERPHLLGHIANLEAERAIRAQAGRGRLRRWLRRVLARAAPAPTQT